ncbi:LysR family transcriptional regulator [Microvirga sp. W0021]|uniref:LysR family transcriptional regulator n=1 Tax=Hohaiivirga grylli TaxID=3133970 RepID=A0ABV0BK12_9HYPH
MARIDINRSGEMQVFVTVVEHGNFSSAANICRMSPSAISKLIARLEARLNTRLLNRSTRRFQLTPEGRDFYKRATHILADIDEAERTASIGAQPVGRIRLNTNASYGTHILAHILPEFFKRYPEITLDIAQTDTVVDLLADRTDVAVRAGPLKSSALIARKLGETTFTIVASPTYLKQHGIPETIADLKSHNRLGFSYTRATNGWPLLENGLPSILPITGNIQINDGEALRHLVLTGNGLARLSHFTVKDDIKAGRLIPVLDHLNPGDSEEFHAIYIGQGGPLSARVRALLDFLAEKGRLP